VPNFTTAHNIPLAIANFGFSPLVAAILVSLGEVYRVFLAIFLAWFTTRSGGNLVLASWVHATFNLVPTFLPMSELGLAILWVGVTVGIVVQGRMWRVSTHT
jgi:hypothetical protein